MKGAASTPRLESKFMNFLPQTLIVEKLLAIANELLPTLPENNHKELLINALHEFESEIGRAHV